jgi:uncharacterized protein (TIGR00730 family)
MRRVAVFASRLEIDTPDAFAAAHHLGRLLGENDLTLLYDGSQVGPIATVAQAALVAGGRVIGFLPDGAPASEQLTERHGANSEKEFREAIATQAEAFIGLPGGFPSLDEGLALWDWSPVAKTRPIGLLDLGAYYSDLLKHASDEALDRYVRESQRGQLVVSTQAPELLRRLMSYRPPETRRMGEFDVE